MTNPLPTEQQAPARIWLHGVGALCDEWVWSNDPNPSGDPDEAAYAVEYVRADFAPRSQPTVELSELIEAARPFVNILGDREVRYRARGGNLDDFPDTHPSFDIKAEQIPIGFYRRLRAALSAMGARAC